MLAGFGTVGYARGLGMPGGGSRASLSSRGTLRERRAARGGSRGAGADCKRLAGTRLSRGSGPGKPPATPYTLTHILLDIIVTARRPCFWRMPPPLVLRRTWLKPTAQWGGGKRQKCNMKCFQRRAVQCNLPRWEAHPKRNKTSSSNSGPKRIEIQRRDCWLGRGRPVRAPRRRGRGGARRTPGGALRR